MSSAAGCKTTLPHSADRRGTEGQIRSRLQDCLWCCLVDTKNVPRYVVRYGLLVLALLGAIQLFAARGDGPIPSFTTLSASTELNPNRISSARCMTSRKSEQDRWEGLAPALAILRDTNPEVAQWTESTHEDGRVIFTDRCKDAGDRENFLAKFDLFQRELRISPGLYAEPDGSVAAILCHEYRHSRQRFPKVLSYALSFLFLKGGDPSIIENDAVIYEQEARCAIFGQSDEALDGLAARLAAR